MLNSNNKTTTLPTIPPPKLSIRDRIIVYGGVFLVSAIGWAYICYIVNNTLKLTPFGFKTPV